MIGVLSGKILFSDGQEIIVFTQTGLGYQAYCHHILPEGGKTSLYVSHVIRENSEDLYCFKNLREKKLFELLTTVKGVGPKSAFNLVSKINIDEIISAITLDQKKVLTRVSGIGNKAASQIVLDLRQKIKKVRMYSSKPLKETETLFSITETGAFDKKDMGVLQNNRKNKQTTDGPDFPSNLLEDTVLACENLGFQSDHIIPLAQRILKENRIKKTEQLVHLVLKEI